MNTFPALLLPQLPGLTFVHPHLDLRSPGTDPSSLLPLPRPVWVSSTKKPSQPASLGQVPALGALPGQCFTFQHFTFTFHSLTHSVTGIRVWVKSLSSLPHCDLRQITSTQGLSFPLGRVGYQCLPTLNTAQCTAARSVYTAVSAPHTGPTKTTAPSPCTGDGQQPAWGHSALWARLCPGANMAPTLVSSKNEGLRSHSL